MEPKTIDVSIQLPTEINFVLELFVVVIVIIVVVYYLRFSICTIQIWNVDMLSDAMQMVK